MSTEKALDLANKLDDYQARDIWYEDFAGNLDGRKTMRQVNNAQRAMRHAAALLRDLAKPTKELVPIKPTFCDTNVCVHNTEVTSEAIIYPDRGPNMLFCPGCDFELYIEDKE